GPRLRVMGSASGRLRSGAGPWEGMVERGIVAPRSRGQGCRGRPLDANGCARSRSATPVSRSAASSSASRSWGCKSRRLVAGHGDADQDAPLTGSRFAIGQILGTVAARLLRHDPCRRIAGPRGWPDAQETDPVIKKSPAELAAEIEARQAARGG